MAVEDDLQQPGSPQPPALEERVARLERELDALRRQIAAAPVTSSAFPRAAVAEVWPSPPPPPIPVRPDVAPVSRPVTAAPGIGSASWAVPASQPSMPQKRESLENRLGSEIFNRIGILLLLIGTAWFLKYAVDRQWVGPTGRVAVGLLAGAGIVLWSERFRRKGFASFSYSLRALGSGVLYLSLWAAFHIYHLLPATAALGLMILVTAWNAWMAWAQNSELLAAYALAGGFATPMLLSTGGNHETFLFTYLLAIDIATVALVRLRGWPRLLLGAFPLTVVFFLGWYSQFFVAGELGVTSVFIALFGCAFWSVPIGHISGVPEAEGVPRRSTLIEDLLLPLANAAFVSAAFYSVLQDSGNHALLPWLMIVLAAVYLGFMRLPQSRTASAIHLSLAVIFLTIAVPLKASGHWITVSWLVEGLALLWVSTRLAAPGTEIDAGTAQASRILRPLAVTSLLLGFCGICARSISWASAFELPLLNKITGTALTGIAVFATAAWLSLRTAERLDAEQPEIRSQQWGTIAIAAFLLIDGTAIMLTLRELLFSAERAAVHPPFQTADFVTALIGLAVFAGVVVASLRRSHKQPEIRFWPNCAALSTIAFNLVAVLTGVREIDAIWDFPAANTAANLDAALQQALAISGFLMLYGAALLAAGFWKRSAFLRWQALLLLVFTIFKAFLYDMRNLSQGYRVVSFLGLGALLMAISFAYQKDWLNLRAPQPDETSADSSEAAR
jgi:uncharacterized membrane protein